MGWYSNAVASRAHETTCFYFLDDKGQRVPDSCLREPRKQPSPLLLRAVCAHIALVPQVAASTSDVVRFGVG